VYAVSGAGVAGELAVRLSVPPVERGRLPQSDPSTGYVNPEPGPRESLRQPPGTHPPVTPWGARIPAAAGAPLLLVRYEIQGGRVPGTRTSSSG
jgi:hypothetical protein